MQNEGDIIKYSDIKAKRIEWLWYPYIAYGKITLLQGDPGDGKSTFALQLVALLTTGRKLPDGARGKAPINVIYQCQEDDPTDTIKPRLMEAGADCEKVWFFNRDLNITLDSGDLEKAVEEAQARLVIFDPIQSFLPADADMMSAGKMRSILSHLSEIAQKHKCAVLLIGHLNKSPRGKDLYRLLGSIDIAASARSVLMVTRDEENADIRYVSQIKNNIGFQGLTISFEISKKGFRWGGVIQPENVEENQLQTTSPIEKAKEALISILQDGDVRASEIKEHLELMEITDRTARRAREVLNVRTYKKGRVWYWHLPSENEVQKS